MNTTPFAGLTPAELQQKARQLGNTPLQPISLVIDGVARQVHLKLESANPTGSVKDRMCHLLEAWKNKGGIL